MVHFLVFSIWVSHMVEVVELSSMLHQWQVCELCMTSCSFALDNNEVYGQLSVLLKWQGKSERGYYVLPSVTIVVYHLPKNSVNFSQNVNDKMICFDQPGNFWNKWNVLKGSPKLPTKISWWKMCLPLAILHRYLGIMIKLNSFWSLSVNLGFLSKW